MSTSVPSLTPDPATHLAPSGPTLADVLARLPDFTVSEQARQNMASGCRTLSRIIDRPTELTPIAAPSLRRIMDLANPGAFGISARRWLNIKSDVRRAIRLSGLTTAAIKLDLPLNSGWEALAVLAPDRTSRSILRRLGRYCSARQIPPGQVDDNLIRDYLVYLDANQLSRSPARSVADLIRAWNRHVAKGPAATYRPLTASSRSRKYTLDWADLPAALHADVQAYHQACLHPDPLDADARRAVRASTVYARDRLLRRIATAEILNGIDRNDLQSLADLVDPERLKPGLRFLLARNDGKPNKQLADALGLVLGIARHWVRAPVDQIDEIRLLERRFRCRQRGLTEKNRERLRQFTDMNVLRTFVALPNRIIDKAKRQPLQSRCARRVQTALAIALLLIAPVRIGNLVNLDRQRHFKWGRFDGERVLHLVIPAEEVKNAVDLEYPVPATIAAQLENYMSTYQPLLTNGHPSSLLFPGRKGGPKRDTALRRQIVKTIRDEAGLAMNPHLFRHLAALLFLENHPGHYEEVKRLLGHKNIDTTIQSYAGLETIGAVRRYDTIILNLRDGTDDA